LKRDVKFALRERFGGADTTAFQVGWLYDYDVGRELERVPINAPAMSASE
jgi:hypothetical protein